MSNRRLLNRAGIIRRAAVEVLDPRLMMSVSPGGTDVSFNFGNTVAIGGAISGGRVVDIYQRESDTASVWVLTEAPSVKYQEFGDNRFGSVAGGLILTKYFADGNIDQTFADHGRFVFNSGIGVRGARLLDAGAGNGFYLVGSAFRGTVVPDGMAGTLNDANPDALVVRVTEDGQIDRDFNNGPGFKQYEISGDGSNSLEFVENAVMTADGGIVMQGSYYTSPLQLTEQLFFLKINSDGTRNTGFGESGAMTSAGVSAYSSELEAYSSPKSMVVDSFGSIYVGGQSSMSEAQAVMKLTSAGVRAPEWGTNGVIEGQAAFSGGTATTEALVAWDPNGDGTTDFIAWAGLQSQDVYFVRFSPGGTYDAGFGVRDLDTLAGYVADSVQMQQLGGSSSLSVVMRQSNSGGSDDVIIMELTSGGTSARKTTFETGILTNQDRILMGSGRYDEVAVAGNLFDESRTDGGTNAFMGTIVPKWDGTATPNHITTGQIDTFGNATARGSVANPDGSIATVFAGNDPFDGEVIGLVLTDRDGNQTVGTGSSGFKNISVGGISRLSNGKYIVVFSAVPNGDSYGNGDVVVARYNADGTLDGSYGSGGFTVGFSLTGQSDDAIVRASVYDEGTDTIYGAGSINGNAYLFKIVLSSGSANGAVQSAGEYRAVILDGAGGIYAGGVLDMSGVPTGFAERRGANLGQDSTFGGGTRVFIDRDGGTSGQTEVYSLLRDTVNGRLYVGGAFYPDFSGVPSVGRSFMMTALDGDDGTLSTGFNGSGRLLVGSSPQAFHDGAYAMVQDTDGGILVAGAQGDVPTVFNVGADGTFVTSYVVQVDPDGVTGRYLDIVLDPVGRPIVSGEVSQIQGAPRPGILRRLGATTPVEPTVAVEAAPTGAPAFKGSVFFDVRYTARGSAAIDASTISAANLVGKLDGNVSGGFFVENSTMVAPGEYLVRYRYQPGGNDGFTDLNEGVYTFFFASTAVKDAFGVAADVPSGPIATFTTDYTQPFFALLTPPTVGYGDTSLILTYQYSHPSGMDTASFSSTNLFSNFPGAITYLGNTFNAATSTYEVMYRLDAPNGSFTEADNGAYVLQFSGDSPKAVTGEQILSNTPAGSFVISLSPRVTVSPVTVVRPQFGAGSVQFVVTYTAAADRTINASTIGLSNLSVLFNTGPGASGTITAFNILSNTGTSVTVAYTFVPDGGVFNFASNGSYLINFASGTTVQDTGGNTVNPGTEALFDLNYVPGIATLQLSPIPSPDQTTYSFLVTYTPAGQGSINPDLITVASFTVLGPNGQSIPLSLTAGMVGTSVQVLYSFQVAGGFGQNAGLYLFLPTQGAVVDNMGVPVGIAAAAGSLDIQYTKTSASIVEINQPQFGDTQGTIVVEFTAPPGRFIDPAQITGDEITVTYPDGSTRVLTLVGAPTLVSGGSVPVSVVTLESPQIPSSASFKIRATYAFVAPGAAGSTFGLPAQGTYTFNFLAGTVIDSANQANDGAVLATDVLDFGAPVATGTPPGTPAVGAASVDFTITYTGSDGGLISRASLGNDDLIVTLPNGQTASVTLESISSDVDAATLVVTYRLAAPNGAFTSADGGLYVIRVVAGAVLDTDGVPVAAGTVYSAPFALGALPEVASVTVNSGPYLPGAGLAPVVTVTNNSSDSSQAYVVRLVIKSSTGLTIVLGDYVFNTLAAGQSRTINFAGRVALPSSLNLSAGSYTLSAQVVSVDGLTTTSAVTAGASVVVVAPVAPTPGKLDPNFGGGSGQVTTFVQGPVITLVGSVAQPGQILVAGGYNDNGDFVLVRFLADGSQDMTFGVDGVLVVDVSGGVDVASAVFGDSQGRILVGGTSTVNGVSTFSVVRFNADGTLDTTFNGTGKLLYTPAGSSASLLRSITADSFGRPYLLGSVQASQTQGGPVDSQGAVIRLTPFGAVDITFGAQGVISAAFANGRKGVLPLADGKSEITSLLLLPNRIVIGGYSGTPDGSASRFVVAGLTYGGALDTKFGSGGVYATELGTTRDRVSTLLARSDDSIYVGGSRGTGTSTTAVIFRITGAGKTDKSFNKGQVLPLNAGTVFSTVSSLLGSVNDTVLITVATTNSLAQAAAGLIGTTFFRLTSQGANDPMFNGGASLIVVDVPLVTAAVSTGGDFDSFITSKQGATQVVDGGLIRAIASQPVGLSDDAGTAVTVVQLSPDGVDLSALLSGSFPATVKPGFKGMVTLTISNVGSLTSTKKFSVRLIADSTDAGIADLVLPAVNVGGRFTAGTSRTVRVRVTIPKDAPAGTYRLQATLVAEDDVNAGNDSSGHPDTFVISASSTKASALRPVSEEIAPAASRALFASSPVTVGSDKDDDLFA